MSEPYIAEIILFAGNFAIRNYSYCSGQLLSISQNSALFSLVGTTYGGDGRVTFGLPDLRGRVAVGSEGNATGPGLDRIYLGQKGGANNHTLTAQQLANHTHNMRGAGEDANSGNVAGTYPATTEGNNYHTAGDSTMGTTTATGSNQSFSIQQPYLGLNFLIALQGIFPSPN